MSEQETDGLGPAQRKVRDWVMQRLYAGRYEVGDQLPSQRALADAIGVSRSTVQQALNMLAAEHWVEGQQGSGTTVLRRPSIASPQGPAVAPDSLMDEVFKQTEVLLDVFSLTSESLVAPITRQYDRIRRDKGSEVQRIRLRMLLPSEDLDLPYPRAVDADRRDAITRRRVNETRTHVRAITQKLRDLKANAWVRSVEVEVRHVPLPPAHKVYLVNGTQLMLAPYKVIEQNVDVEGEVVALVDVEGVGASITHVVRNEDPGSPDSVMVASHQVWFDSLWETLAK
ncbi:GntR family transcriptional regulator [Streptomyces sp. NPDC001068]|uniref:GntR family transcriptional regulator n=1 Tax=Streptomyces sp. NPDC001068 TaxID=3364544 RepID=UPI0036C712D8